MNQLSRPDKILIVKLSAIGDVIHALPTARVLRQNYPEAEISWIVEDKAKDMVLGNPHLDEVIILPKGKWKEEFKEDKWRTLKEVKNFFKGLREKRIDLAIDLQGLFKSGIITYLSGAKRRVGYSDGREGSTLFYNKKVEPREGEIPVVDRYLELIEAVGAEVNEVKFDIEVNENEKDRVDKLLGSLPSSQQKKLVGINPFTSWSSKNWPKEKYAKLAERLVRELDLQVLFTGGSGDREGIDNILEMMEEPAYNLAGKTSLKELAELYSRIDIFVGGDTGPMHLAVAQEVPVVAIMGPTTPERNGPYGEGHVVIQKDLECKNCWQRVCDRDLACMKDIEVEEVLSAIKGLIGVGSDE